MSDSRHFRLCRSYDLGCNSSILLLLCKSHYGNDLGRPTFQYKKKQWAEFGTWVIVCTLKYTHLKVELVDYWVIVHLKLY